MPGLCGRMSPVDRRMQWVCEQRQRLITDPTADASRILCWWTIQIAKETHKQFASQSLPSPYITCLSKMPKSGQGCCDYPGCQIDSIWNHLRDKVLDTTLRHIFWLDYFEVRRHTTLRIMSPSGNSQDKRNLGESSWTSYLTGEFTILFFPLFCCYCHRW